MGERLRALRQAQGLRQSDVAERLGVVPGTYRHYEAGRHEPALSELPEIAEALGVEPSHLCERLFGAEPSAGRIVPIRPRQVDLTHGGTFLAGVQAGIARLGGKDRRTVELLLGVVEHVLQEAG